MTGIGHNSRSPNIIRANPDDSFTKISNRLLQDARLSYETRGLLVELLSRPDDWEITVQAIVRSGPAGRDKVYRMMREAEQFGYAATKKDRHDDGSFAKHGYRVSDDPQLLIERAATELDELLPENPEVDESAIVILFPGNQEVASQKATIAKPVSGHPLPDNPDTAQPLTAKPTRTNKRKIQTDTSLRSVSHADDGVPDDKKLVWGKGVDWLVEQSGKSRKSLQPLVGKWLKTLMPTELLNVMRSAAKAKAEDPITYIAAVVEQTKGSLHSVRREHGRIKVFNGFEAELAKLLNGRDLALALTQIEGRIPLGIVGVELETRVRSGIADIVARGEDQDRRYAAAAATKGDRMPQPSSRDLLDLRDMPTSKPRPADEVRS